MAALCELNNLAAEVEGAWKQNFRPPYAREGAEHAFLRALAALGEVRRSSDGSPDPTGEVAARRFARLAAGLGVRTRLLTLCRGAASRWGVEVHWDDEWHFFDAANDVFFRRDDGRPTAVLAASTLLATPVDGLDHVRNEAMLGADDRASPLCSEWRIAGVLPEESSTPAPPAQADGLAEGVDDLDAVAAAVLAQARAGREGPPPARDVCQAAIDYVQLHVRPYLWGFLREADPQGPPHSVRDALRRGAGVCGNQANVFGELARRLGLEARRVQLFWRTPTGRATNHVCVEVKWDDTWHFFDLTHGTWFRDGSGDVASLAQRLVDSTCTPLINRATLFHQVNRILGWDDPLDYLRPDCGLDRLHGGVGDLHPPALGEPARTVYSLTALEPLLGQADDPSFQSRGDVRYVLPVAPASVRWIDLRVEGRAGVAGRVRATFGAGWRETSTADIDGGLLRIDVSDLETRGLPARLEVRSDTPDAVSYLALGGIETTPCWPATPHFLLPPDAPDARLRYDAIVVVQTEASPRPNAGAMRAMFGAPPDCRLLVLRQEASQTRAVVQVSGADAEVVILSLCASAEVSQIHAALHERRVMRPLLVIETLALEPFVASRFSPLKVLHVTAAMREERVLALPGADAGVVDEAADREWLEARGFTAPVIARGDGPLHLVPDGDGRPLNVLFLYEAAWTHVGCIQDDLAAAARHMGHEVWFAPATVAGGEPGCPLDLRVFDVVIIHYAVRVSLPAYLSSEYAAALRAFGGYKVLFMQDDYETTETSRRWVEDLGIHHVFTAVPAHGMARIFPAARFPQVEFQHRSTGFVSDALETHPRVPLRDRPLVIGYRGRELRWSYGRLGREKLLIGQRMREICEARGVAADIAWDEASRFYGDAWPRFLESSRASLGTESGSNVFDDHGEIRRQIERALEADPSMTFEAAFDAFLAPHEGRVRMNQISPRALEAVALGTALVLFDGDYSGVLRPHEHYIPLAKDFSNADEVLALLDDLPSLEAMTERAWQHVVGSGLYTYRAFYQRLGRVLSRRVRHPGGRRLLQGVYAEETGDGVTVRVRPRGAPTRAFYTCPQPYDRQTRLGDEVPAPRRPAPVDAFHLLTPIMPSPVRAVEARARVAARCDGMVLISSWRDAELWDAVLHFMADAMPVYAVVVGVAAGPRGGRRGVRVLRASAAFTASDEGTVNEALCTGGTLHPCVLSDETAADGFVARRHAALRVRVGAAADMDLTMAREMLDPWDLAPLAARLADALEAPPPAREAAALNLLLLYCDGATQVGCVRDDIEALLDLSAHRVFAAPATNQAPAVDLGLFDAVLLTYSVRLSLEAHLSPAYVAALERFGGFKAAIITDEYEGTETARGWIERLGLHAVFTAVPPAFVPAVYPRARFPRVEFVHKLTGFVPAALEALDDLPPPAARPCVLGYRGRRLPFWYGELGHDKYRIGVAMREACEGAGLACDIEWNEELRLDGPDWIRFHLRCKAVLASESGSRIFDGHGRVRARVEAWLAAHPGASFEEVWRAFLGGLEEIPMEQVSPRIFEAAATRTALVLFEGAYSGVLRPHEHFIPLRKDLGNVGEVLALLADDDHLARLTERAWRHVVGSGMYSYRRYCQEFDGWLRSRVRGLSPRALTRAAVGHQEPDGTRHMDHEAQALRFVLHWYSDVYPRSSRWQEAWYARQAMTQAAEAEAAAREAAEAAARKAAGVAAREAAEAVAREAAEAAAREAAEAAAREAALEAIPAWRKNGAVRWVDACICRPFAMVWEYNRLMVAGWLGRGEREDVEER